MADLPPSPCPLGIIQSLYKGYNPSAGTICKECSVGESVDELFQECSGCGCFVRVLFTQVSEGPLAERAQVSLHCNTYWQRQQKGHSETQQTNAQI
eukprot:scaffold7349_cov129-Skeletonema_dohrnii-CCMP3373.AAC.11